PPRRLEVVLQVDPEQRLAVVALEVGARLRDLELLSGAGEEVDQVAEAQPPAAAAVGEAVVAEVLEVEAGLQRVAPADDVEVVAHLEQVLAEVLRVVAVGPDVGQAGDVDLA